MRQKCYCQFATTASVLLTIYVAIESKGTRRKRRYDEDYYSSDEDTFLDRTGAAERKRQAKLKGKSVGAVETYESLVR